MTVIEIFIPRGFAYDYEWTTRAMRGKHFAIWNDTYVSNFPSHPEVVVDHISPRYHSYPNTPGVDYPEGFQGTNIPVHGPAVAKLIEDRLDGKLP